MLFVFFFVLLRFGSRRGKSHLGNVVFTFYYEEKTLDGNKRNNARNFKRVIEAVFLWVTCQDARK